MELEQLIASAQRRLSCIMVYWPIKMLEKHRVKKDIILPDFLGIGVQKSGTAWVYRNLKCHPDIYMSDKKEVHYFDRYFYYSLEEYSKIFEKGCEKIKGEITPAYATLSIRHIEYIRAIMPNLKIILMLRNPIDRAWSAVKMNLLGSDATKNHKNRPYNEIDQEEFMRRLKKRHYLEYGDYLKIIQKWEGVFGEENIFIGFFDDIKTQPKSLLTDLFNFLGVSDDVEWNSFPFNQKFNAGKRVDMPDDIRSYLSAIYKKDIELLKERFGDKVGGWG